MLTVGALGVHLLDESPRVILLRSGSSSLIGLFFVMYVNRADLFERHASGVTLSEPTGCSPRDRCRLLASAGV